MISLTKQIQQRFYNPQFAYKSILQTDQEGKRFVVGEEGDLEEGEKIVFYLLVDVKQGLISSISYQIFGEPLLCIAAEALCELVLGKNLLQASRISVDLLEKSLKEGAKECLFDEQDKSLFNKVLFAFYQALEGCEDLVPYLSTYSSPLTRQDPSQPLLEPSQWSALEKDQKIALIRSVIETDVQPYLELDAGGADVKDIVGDNEVILTFKGSCTSCYSSIGATLQSIDRILKQKIHPAIFVTPDVSVLQL